MELECPVEVPEVWLSEVRVSKVVGTPLERRKVLVSWPTYRPCIGIESHKLCRGDFAVNSSHCHLHLPTFQVEPGRDCITWVLHREWVSEVLVVLHQQLQILHTINLRLISPENLSSWTVLVGKRRAILLLHIQCSRVVEDVRKVRNVIACKIVWTVEELCSQVLVLYSTLFLSSSSESKIMAENILPGICSRT